MKFAAFFYQHGLKLLHPESLPIDQDPASLSFASIGKMPSFDHPPLDLDYTFSHSLQQALHDKLLLLSELPFPIQLLHEHYLHGYVGFMKSVVLQEGTYICNRCGNHEQRLFAQILCARCGEECTYCRKCVTMGRASECTPLVYWRGSEWHAPISSDQLLVWNGVLTPEQSQASEQVIEAVLGRKRLLVWAVCGSGKTEILYRGIEEALKQQMRVCIATPRTDVVLELEPRLKRVFPNVPILSLYSGSPRTELDSPFVISTTHQLLRYRHAFDVVIIDEVDAFPYSYDNMLAFAVNRAKKRHASTVFLTATPNKQLKKEAASGELPVVKIPVRYHRHPMPVPRFIWCGNWEKLLKKRKVPIVVLEWLQKRTSENKQCLLFVPTVDIAVQLEEILSVRFKVASVYSEDPERKKKVEQFRRGELDMLITTTILERGVTVPNIDVAVFGAEHSVFTESALVQIAGRVGRSAEFPDGDVCFFHFGKTKAMLDSVRHIVEMNQYAR